MKNQRSIELLEKSATHRAAARDMRLKFEQMYALAERADEKFNTSRLVDDEVSLKNIVDQCSQLSNGAIAEDKKSGALYWGARNEFLASVEGTRPERDSLWCSFLEDEGFSFLA